MSIGAKMLPIQESMIILDFLLLCQNEKCPEKLLLDLLGRMLYYTEPKVMCLNEEERKNYMSQGKFVETCLNEMTTSELFSLDLKNDWFN